jgi:hypothetical protein
LELLEPPNQMEELDPPLSPLEPELSACRRRVGLIMIAKATLIAITAMAAKPKIMSDMRDS